MVFHKDGHWAHPQAMVQQVAEAPGLLAPVVAQQTSRKPTDTRTMSAGDFGFLRHFLTCLSFVRASVWLGGA